jgi:hypothetical protein
MGRLVHHKPAPVTPTRSMIAGRSLGRLSIIAMLVGLGLWLHGWIGLLLLVAGTDLAMSRRPLAPRPICWPALAFAAGGMLLVDPAVALACGWLVELACDPALPALPASGRAEGRSQAPDGAKDASDPGDWR